MVTSVGGLEGKEDGVVRRAGLNVGKSAYGAEGGGYSLPVG